MLFSPMRFSEYRAYKSDELRLKKYSNFKWDCIPMPVGPDGENVSLLEVLPVAVNAKTEHGKLAWEFAKMLTCDEEIQAEIFDYSDGLAVRKSVTGGTREGNADSGGGIDREVLSYVMEHTAANVRFRGYDDAMAEVGRAVDEILAGESNFRMKQIILNRELNLYLDAENEYRK